MAEKFDSEQHYFSILFKTISNVLFTTFKVIVAVEHTWQFHPMYEVLSKYIQHVKDGLY